MRIRTLPCYLAGGLLVFPLLLAAGALLALFSDWERAFFFWAVIPGVIFEQATEGWSRALSDQPAANLAFLLLFWFTLGALAGIVADRVQRLLRRG